MFQLFNLWLKLIWFIVPFALAATNKNQSVTGFAYFNLNSTDFVRCENGLLSALAASLGLSNIDGLLSILGLKNSTTPTSNTRTKRSSVLTPNLESDEHKEYLSYKPDEEVLTADERLNQVGAAGTWRGIASLLKLLLNIKNQYALQTPNKRSLQSKPLTTDILKDFQPAIMRLLSPTFTTLLKNMFGPLEGLTVSQANVSLGDAMCIASSFSRKYDVDPSPYVCAIENIMFTVTQCTEFPPPTCNDTLAEIYLPEKCYTSYESSKHNDVDLRKYSEPFVFDDIRVGNPPMLPQRLSQELYEQEGFYYFLLYRAMEVASMYTYEYYPCGHDIEESTFIPGFRVLHQVMYEQLDITVKEPEWKSKVPFLVVLESIKKSGRCQYIFIIRGTANKQEWVFNYGLKMVDFVSPGSKMHQGYGMLTFITLTEIFRLFRIHDIFSECSDVDFIITGSSLGGSVTKALGVSLSYLFPQINVTAVSFASPQIFNKEAEDLYRRHVNGRNIRIDIDPVAQLFCTTDKYEYGTYLCNRKTYNPDNWMPFVSTSAVYDIKFSQFSKNMNGVTNTWLSYSGGKMKFTIPETLQIAATHGCGYRCALSHFCKPVLNATPNKLWSCQRCYGIISLEKLLK